MVRENRHNKVVNRQAAATVVELDSKPCWRINGVWGKEKPRCDKLKFVGHCRNCDVFEKAARMAVVEGSGDNELKNNSLSFDDLVQQQRLSGDKSILPFRLEGYCFAIPTDNVITIHDQVHIHSIPFNRNATIKGVVSIKHEIYSFVNIAELLSLPPAGKTESNLTARGLYKYILVLDIKSRKVAFYVDEVYPIYRYYRQAINDELPDSFFDPITQGRLLKENRWCGDCHILDIKSVSNVFENSF